MPHDAAPVITVLDFRRRRMAVRWDVSKATWTSHEEDVPTVYGIALIRPGQPGICLYGHDGELQLQIGELQLQLGASEPSISCQTEPRSLGTRRLFKITDRSNRTLYQERHWASKTPAFLQALTDKAADPQWRLDCARLWSDGIDAARLRASWPS